MSRRFQRTKSVRRRPAFRDPGSRILILCGGKVTEPEYFRGLVRAVHNPAVQPKVATSTSDPIQLVEQAIERLRDDQFDEAWCVADMDDFQARVEQAYERADGYPGVQLAISNPCFELWLLLHFQDRRAPAANCKALARALARHVPGYDKTIAFKHFAAGVPDAIQRAKILASGGDRCPNPSTSVWKLVEKITTISTTQRRRSG